MYSAPGTLESAPPRPRDDAAVNDQFRSRTSHLPILKFVKTATPPTWLRVRTTSILYMYPAPGRGNAVGEITGPAALPARQGAGTPCSVNTDSLTNDPDPRLTVGANMHTCLLRRRPSDRRRQTQGLQAYNPPEYLQSTARVTTTYSRTTPPDRRRKHADAHLRRRRFHHDPTRTQMPNPEP